MAALLIDPITTQSLPPNSIQRVLYLAPRVHVYRIPPITSTRGFNAASWTSNPKDLIFTARLRILETAIPIPASSAQSSAPSTETDEKVKTDVLLEDASSGQLFAGAPYTHPSTVEQALDSSRFFAVRVVGERGMKATLGMGFEERSDAFDFSVALQDARRTLGLDGGGAAQKGSAPGRKGGPQAQAAEEPKKDFSLKEGETITINIGGRGRRAGGGSSASGSAQPPSSSGDALFSIAPPPSAAQVKADRRRSGSRNSGEGQKEQQSAQDFGFDDGEFGEFQ